MSAAPRSQWPGSGSGGREGPGAGASAWPQWQAGEQGGAAPGEPSFVSLSGARALLTQILCKYVTSAWSTLCVAWMC